MENKEAIDMMPRRSQGEGEDIAWKLDKRIAELEATT